MMHALPATDLQSFQRSGTAAPPAVNAKTHRTTISLPSFEGEKTVKSIEEEVTESVNN